MRLLPLLPLFPLLTARRSSHYRRVFGQPAKMACEGMMSAKSILLLFLVSLLSISLLACADGGSSSSGSNIGGGAKSSGPLELLPDDTVRLEVLKVGDILGGAVPESF